jgi:hypothetical protein
VCSYFYSKKYSVFVWTSGLAWLRDESSKIQLQAIFNLLSKQQNCPSKQDEIFSYKHKRNSSRLPGCLAKWASLALT